MFWTIVITGILAVLLQHGVRYYFIMDHHKSIPTYRHSPGPCMQLEGAEGGAEDITVLPNGLAFISSGMYTGFRGRILLFDFNNISKRVTELNITGEKFDTSDFNPHGLSVWVNNITGEVTLAVINHAAKGEQVEIFRFEEDITSLLHITTVSLPLFTSTNDLVLTSENTFYITKYSALRENFWLEYRLLLNLGAILYYDGTDIKVLVSGLKMPDGINTSPDGRYLYVAEYKQLEVYRILEDNNLEYIQEYPIGTYIDNIEVDPKTGDLWIGCLPVLYLILEHHDQLGMSDLEIPSQILKVKTSEDKVHDVTEVYLDPGKEMSGSTVASVYKGRMIAGTLTSQMILCDIVYID